MPSRKDLLSTGKHVVIMDRPYDAREIECFFGDETLNELRISNVSDICLNRDLNFISSQKHIEKLVLNNTQTIFCMLDRMTGLTSLTIHYVADKTFPSTFCKFDGSKLINLTELNLAHNGFVQIPEEFECAQNLETLDLSHNRLEKIPDFVFKMKNLKKLNLTQNFIRSIPLVILCLENLRELHISENFITEIPQEILDNRNIKIFKCRKDYKVHQDDQEDQDD